MSDALLSIDRLVGIACGEVFVANLDREKRDRRRVPYEALAAMILVDDRGRKGRPLLLRTRDISLTGVSVVSRDGIGADARGAIQLARSDGRQALVGVIARYCRYLGDMRHLAGLKFAPLPAGLSAEDFLDSAGRMCLLDPLLYENEDS